MENASKALIIAGAILLSILIISLGIMIFGQASGVVDNNSMTELEITTFNEKFTQYFGPRVRGANVKVLIDAVNANNIANAGDESKKIKLYGKDSKSVIQTGKTYTVEAKSDAAKKGYTTGGLIHDISITENTN